MKYPVPVIMLMVVLPSAAQAQIDIVLDGSRPVLRANVAGMVVLAGVDSRGKLDVRLDDGTTRPVSTSGSSRTTSRTSTRTRTSTSTRTSSSARATAVAVLNTADDYVGTKYVWGGTTPNGFDCSGFVQYVFRKHGIELPRTSRQQVQVGQVVARGRSALEVGDLMFFASSGSRINHIAIYAGNDQIIHSSSSGGGVGYDDLSSQRGQWFVNHHVATRRVIAGGQSLVGPLTAALRAFVELDPPDRAPKR
jgi:cell wall-associated NlpC family hydrolase